MLNLFRHLFRYLPLLSRSLALLGVLFCAAALANEPANGASAITASASEKPTKRTITVAFYDFPPFSYMDAHNTPQGPALEFVRQLASKAGYGVHFRLLPSARLYAGILDGSIDLWPGALNKPELAGHVITSRVMVGHTELNLYRRPNTPEPVLPGDLENREIILIHGYTYWQTATQLLGNPNLQVRPRRTSSHESALLMLFKERGDFLLDYKAPVDAARKALDLPPLPHTTLYRLDLSLIFSKYAVNAEQLRDDMDQAYRELIVKGQLREQMLALGVSEDELVPLPLPPADHPASSASDSAP
ncbi:substrate-binding periplasmic protein [Atopomonas sediminilitoris]|uniref:substrate-binding periplasmic protein n=1 Tax=Atopomonas sediminilitoris TaxID=2919919 RepID=UPI001F4EFFF0|nr:transporter substrate-binding domain-containing protein [Atopomonas sediminilitoris]MCJ8168466.1 transporter substrate-binding domain-containing protein [Atopomonas sediminilitoris]